MDAVNMIKERNRMCDSFNLCSNGCPLYNFLRYGNCDVVKNEKAEAYVAAVEKWSKEHPIITNRQKFEEVFGGTSGVFETYLPSCWLNKEYKAPKEDK